jgi:hypothetical protein
MIEQPEQRKESTGQPKQRGEEREDRTAKTGRRDKNNRIIIDKTGQP